MDETMNTGVGVATGVSGAKEVTQKITIEETSSGPSKGFIALVVGGIAAVAVAVGATVATKQHKKKKAAQAEEEFFEDDVEEDLEGEEDDWVETEEDQKEEAESKIERIR